MSPIDVLIKILQICVTESKECAFLKGDDTMQSSSAQLYDFGSMHQTTVVQSAFQCYQSYCVTVLLVLPFSTPQFLYLKPLLYHSILESFKKSKHSIMLYCVFFSSENKDEFGVI